MLESLRARWGVWTSDSAVAGAVVGDELVGAGGALGGGGKGYGSLRVRLGVWTSDVAVAGIVVVVAVAVVLLLVVGSICGVAAVLVGQVADVEVDVRASCAVGALLICRLKIGLVSTVMRSSSAE